MELLTAGLAGVRKQRVPSFQTDRGYAPEKGLAAHLPEPEAGHPHTAAGLARPLDMRY